MKNFIVSGIVISLLLVALPASAHVVVKPAEVGVGQFQTFTMGVPVEKEVPTTSVRLALPDGLKHVTPTVKPGWTITTTDAEITWTGGSIPAGQRDDFSFSAQVPASEAKLQWKAYQTHQDGSVVAWDQDSEHAEHQADFSTNGPASITKVINDLNGADSNKEKHLPLILSGVALALSGLAISRTAKRPA